MRLERSYVPDTFLRAVTTPMCNPHTNQYSLPLPLMEGVQPHAPLTLQQPFSLESVDFADEPFSPSLATHLYPFQMPPFAQRYQGSLVNHRKPPYLIAPILHEMERQFDYPVAIIENGACVTQRSLVYKAEHEGRLFGEPFTPLPEDTEYTHLHISILAVPFAGAPEQQYIHQALRLLQDESSTYLPDELCDIVSQYMCSCATFQFGIERTLDVERTESTQSFCVCQHPFFECETTTGPHILNNMDHDCERTIDWPLLQVRRIGEALKPGPCKCPRCSVSTDSLILTQFHSQPVCRKCVILLTLGKDLETAGSCHSAIATAYTAALDSINKAIAGCVGKQMATYKQTLCSCRKLTKAKMAADLELVRSEGELMQDLLVATSGKPLAARVLPSPAPSPGTSPIVQAPPPLPLDVEELAVLRYPQHCADEAYIMADEWAACATTTTEQVNPLIAEISDCLNGLSCIPDAFYPRVNNVCYAHVTMEDYKMDNWQRPVKLPREILVYLTCCCNKYVRLPNPSDQLDFARSDAATALLNAVKPFDQNRPLQYLGFDAFEDYARRIFAAYQFSSAVEMYAIVALGLAHRDAANSSRSYAFTNDVAVNSMGFVGDSRALESYRKTLVFANRHPIVTPENTLTTGGMLQNVKRMVKGFFAGIAINGAVGGGPQIAFTGAVGKMLATEAGKVAGSIAHAVAGPNFIRSIDFAKEDVTTFDPTRAVDNVDILTHSNDPFPHLGVLNQDFHQSPDGAFATACSTESSQSSALSAPSPVARTSAKETPLVPTSPVQCPPASSLTSQEFVQQTKSHLSSLVSCVRGLTTPEQALYISSGVKLALNAIGTTSASLLQKTRSSLLRGWTGLRGFLGKIKRKFSGRNCASTKATTPTKTSRRTLWASSVRSKSGQRLARSNTPTQSSRATLWRLIRSTRRLMARTCMRIATTCTINRMTTFCSNAVRLLKTSLYSSLAMSVNLVRAITSKLISLRMISARTQRASNLLSTPSTAWDYAENPTEFFAPSSSDKSTDPAMESQLDFRHALQPALQIQPSPTPSRILRCFWKGVERLDSNLESLQSWCAETTCSPGCQRMLTPLLHKATVTEASSQRSNRSTILKIAASAAMPSTRFTWPPSTITQRPPLKPSSKCLSQSTSSASAVDLATSAASASALPKSPPTSQSSTTSSLHSSSSPQVSQETAGLSQRPSTKPTKSISKQKQRKKNRHQRLSLLRACTEPP